LTCDESADEFSLASGVLVSADGFVVTNAHVVEGCRSMTATWISGTTRRSYTPVLKFYDDQRDTAVLKISGQKFDAFGVLARTVRIGERVFAIGNPRGLEQSISEGIVSGNRELDGIPWIQHSAPISPGSSGGALISASGELLGINSRTRKESQNLNFAVPAAALSGALVAARGRLLFLSFPPARESLLSMTPERIRALRQAAEQGDPDSLQILRDTAIIGNVEAMLNLGTLYSGSGRGVPQDYPQAVTWFRAAADQGNAEAQDTLGALYEEGAVGTGVPKDPVQAASWWRKAADQGYARAQTHLGYLYQTGQGVPLDLVQAAALLRSAAEAGNANAEYLLGTMYHDGRGVAQNYAQAAAWYRKAAEQGNTSAQVTLGVAILGGEGIAQSYSESYFWIKLATAGTDPGVNPGDLASILDGIASHLTATELAQEQKRAQTWLTAHPGADR
jgi:TPR repeat protein